MPSSASPDADTGEQTGAGTDPATPWVVLLHDDPVTPQVYVTRTLSRVFGFPRDKAEQLMLEADERGRTVVWSGDRLTAEGYACTLHGYGLQATVAADR